MRRILLGVASLPLNSIINLEQIKSNATEILCICME